MLFIYNLPMMVNKDFQYTDKQLYKQIRQRNNLLSVTF